MPTDPSTKDIPPTVIPRSFQLAALLMLVLVMSLGLALMTRQGHAADHTSSTAQTEQPAQREPIPQASGDGIRRVASVTQLRPEMIDEYKRLHAATWPEVLDSMRESGAQNCSIFLKQIDGRHYLFAYFEFDDSRRQTIDRTLEEQARRQAVLQRWGEATSACQLPLPGQTGIWEGMESVFFMP